MNGIEWDSQKAESNFKKHGITFDEAATVFMDPLSITLSDPVDRNEEREITLEASSLGKVLLVVHVERFFAIIRVISARKATKKERKFYEKGI